MSRNIAGKAAVHPGEGSAGAEVSGGKLIFTKYKEKNGIFLISKDRLSLVLFPEESRVGAIYLARVSSVVKNIDACFVETGPGEICFLSLKEAKFPFLTNRVYDGRILEGDELLVQIARDARQAKQPSATAHVLLSNDYFALVFGPPLAGFSTKLESGQKTALRRRMAEAGILDEKGRVLFGEDFGRGLPGMPSMGVIVRTRAQELAEGTAEELAGYFQDLCDRYMDFLQSALHRTCRSCLRDNNAVHDIMAGVLGRLTAVDEFSELLTDDPLLYAQLEEYRSKHLPEKRLRLYEDAMLPLAKLYSLESRMKEALDEHVWLKSGGYLMIQPTEALTVVDVNSGKYEGRKDDFLKVNLEAAEEIARQLRLRNLSGIIIVDFINMEEGGNREKVMDRLRQCVRCDRVKTVVIDMTPLGLVEITRRRITRPLREQCEM